MNSLNAQQKEDLRHALMEVLAIRFPASFDVPAIRRRLEKNRLLDFTVSDDDLKAALEFMREKAFVQFTFAPLGSTQYWSATADGVQKYERNQL